MNAQESVLLARLWRTVQESSGALHLSVEDDSPFGQGGPASVYTAQVERTNSLGEQTVVGGQWAASLLQALQETLRSMGESTDPTDVSEGSREALATELTQIKVALGQVAVYQGLVETSPVALLVDGLVRDHEELEARIDAAMMHLAASKDGASDTSTSALDQAIDLLRGGTRFADTIEEIG